MSSVSSKRIPKENVKKNKPSLGLPVVCVSRSRIGRTDRSAHSWPNIWVQSQVLLRLCAGRAYGEKDHKNGTQANAESDWCKNRGSGPVGVRRPGSRFIFLLLCVW